MRRELRRKSGSKGERVDREGTWRIESEDVTQKANKKRGLSGRVEEGEREVYRKEGVGLRAETTMKE